MVCQKCYGKGVEPRLLPPRPCRACGGYGVDCAGEGEQEQPDVPNRAGERGQPAANSWHRHWWEDYCRRTGLLPPAKASA